jgi:nucleoside-diphosphate-sugar epimerase
MDAGGDQMKIFVAGATGVLGRRSVEALVRAGHDVTGIARSDAKAKLLTGIGATPSRIDVFDADAVRGAVAGSDVVMNLATHIPAPSKYVLPGVWKENDRLRREASKILVDGAISGGASRYVQESIAFVYEDRGDQWIDEDVPLQLDVAYLYCVAVAESQARRFTESGGTGIVLRFGQFYGADTVHTQLQVRAANRGVSTYLGPADAYTPEIQLDDAASAVVAALSAPAGTYNVVDDESLQRSALDDVMAAAVGRKRLRRTPAGLLKAGGKKIGVLTRSQRVSNHRFKDATGWKPAYPSAREGLPAVVAAMDGSRR